MSLVEGCEECRQNRCPDENENLLPTALVKPTLLFLLLFAVASRADSLDAKQTDTKLFARWHKAALERGVFLAPSAFEAGFVSSAHSDADIAVTIKELDAALDDAVRG